MQVGLTGLECIEECYCRFALVIFASRWDAGLSEQSQLGGSYLH